MSAWSLLSNLTVFQSYYCSMYLLLQDYVQSIYEAEFFFRDLPEIPGAIEAAQEINKMEEYVYHGKTSLFFFVSVLFNSLLVKCNENCIHYCCIS